VLGVCISVLRGEKGDKRDCPFKRLSRLGVLYGERFYSWTEFGGRRIDPHIALVLYFISSEKETINCFLGVFSVGFDIPVVFYIFLAKRKLHVYILLYSMFCEHHLEKESSHICSYAAKKNSSCGCILKTPSWTVARRYIWAETRCISF